LAHPIPDQIIRRIKETANIVDVVAESVVLKKSGRNHLGLCPFHAEKTASFTVSEDKQIFYCFGCHKGGSVFNFLMLLNGMSFPEAVRSIAAKYGIEIPDENISPFQKQKLNEKERILQINEATRHFYCSMLNDSRIGQKATAYLVGRGMTRKIIESFSLGFAPDAWDALLKRASGKKVTAQWLEKCGLVIPRKDRSGYYDRFRNRVIFPIFNFSSQVIGFGGRVMTDELPKYLNSPETPVFNKSSSLYGIHRARPAARSAGRVFLVEGYFDVLALHLYGIENSVATLGTALTPEHVDLLKGMVGSGQVVLVFDSDNAGIQAARRSIPIFEQKYMEARVLVLPRGYDPDLYLRENGPDDFLKAADKAVGMIPFLIETAIEKHGLSIAGKVKVVADLQDILAAVQDSVARSLYIQMVAERLSIDETAILEKIREMTPTVHGADNTMTRVEPTGDSDAHRLEQRILEMMVHFPEMVQIVQERNFLEKFDDPQLKTIAEKVVASASGTNRDVVDWMNGIDDERYRNMVAHMAIDDEQWDRLGCERLLAQFEAIHERRAAKSLQRQIKDAEKSNNYDLLYKLLRQKQIQAGKGLRIGS
jgi:DNA primase